MSYKLYNFQLTTRNKKYFNSYLNEFLFLVGHYSIETDIIGKLQSIEICKQKQITTRL